MTLRVALAALALVATGCASAPPPADPDAGAIEAGVRATLDAQVAAWNAGSVRDFMEGYLRSEDLTFLSGGNVRKGWEEALYGYVRGYPDAAAMGQLTFSDLDIQALAADKALVWGRWRLQRDGDAPGAGPGGLFTLLFVDTPDGWRVAHDHTSSE
ncbi:YybH family protein [Rubrivirga sp. IMCC45206]|uniref:YybH family protein n=1 Tax=Rubrivirga sp. IMCC45206 TaxID=3391614 RepID=UPI00399013E4